MQAADRAAEKEDAKAFFKNYKADEPRRRQVAATAGNAPEVATEPPEGYSARVNTKVPRFAGKRKPGQR